ncbi:MAG: hypothetical protein L6R45_21175 [Anaerolineae bacterium]|nr:hypothetical protein [Anaerolineae bacterium]
MKKIVDTAQDAPKTVILAGDEASWYLQATLQIVWAARGQTPQVKRHPGRESTHFYGALNLLNGQDIAIMRSPLMNAETSALFLEKILLAYPVLSLTILVQSRPGSHARPSAAWGPPPLNCTCSIHEPPTLTCV